MGSGGPGAQSMTRTCVLVFWAAMSTTDSVVINEPAMQLLDRRNKTALHAVRSNVAITRRKQAVDSHWGVTQQQQAEQRAAYAVEAAVEMRFEAVTQKLASCAVKDFRSLADELQATADLLRKTAFDVEKRSVKLLALRVKEKPGTQPFGQLSSFGSGGMSKDVQATLKYGPDGSESFDDVEIHVKAPPKIEFHEAPKPQESQQSSISGSISVPPQTGVVKASVQVTSAKAAAPKDGQAFRGKAAVKAVPIKNMTEDLIHDGPSASPPQGSIDPKTYDTYHSQGRVPSPAADGSRPQGASDSNKVPSPAPEGSRPQGASASHRQGASKAEESKRQGAIPMSYDDFATEEAVGGDDEALSVGTPVMPFGAESVGHELQARAGKAQDNLVDAMEAAEVAEIKRSIFRALTRLRSATIKEFDTIARLETQAIDAYNDAHNYRDENPLRHLHEDEAPPATDKLSSFHA